MCVTSLCVVHGLIYGLYCNRFSLYIYYILSQAWGLQHSSRWICQRGTAINALQQLQSPANPTLVTHDSSAFRL